MNKIKISYDNHMFQSKPSGDEIRGINSRIARSPIKIDRSEIKKRS